MLVFGSEMHLVTLVFVILGLMMFTYQLHHYYSRPKDKPRLWYLILLALLIVYNVTGGLFPDPGIAFFSVKVQNMIAYGSGFLMASYFPFYFYKAFNLKSLRFQALYGVPLFLLLPYLLFFGVFYAISGDLDFALSYGLVVPFFYSLYMLWAILYAIRMKFNLKRGSPYPPDHLEVMGGYLAVFPWVSLSVFAYFNITQWIEVLVTNLGFTLLTILFMVRSVARARIEDKKFLAMCASRQLEFQNRSDTFGLTKKEVMITALLCKGLTYREIANHEFISEKTVDTHIRHIFLKTGVNRKIELMQKLGFADEFILSHNASYT